METSRLRNITFYLQGAVVFMLIFASDYYNFSDTLLVVYGLMGILSFKCALLFSYGWWRKKDALGIYKAITFLLYGIAYSMAWQFYARWRFVCSPSDYQSILTCLWWQYRNVPQIISTVYISAFAWSQLKGVTMGNVVRALPEIDTFFEVFKDLKTQDWIWVIKTGRAVVAESVEEFKTYELAIAEIEVVKKSIHEAQIYVKFAPVRPKKED